MLNVEMLIRNAPKFSVFLEKSQEYKILQQSTTVTKETCQKWQVMLVFTDLFIFTLTLLLSCKSFKPYRYFLFHYTDIKM
jgi:hypothetical protein